MTRHHKPGRTLAVALATLAACLSLAALVPELSLGALGPGARASSTQVLRLSARPSMSLRFSTGHLYARAGRITLVMHNPSNAGMSHGIAVSGHGVRRSGAIVGPGHSSILTLTLGRGNYTFYCPVPGHEQAGMKGVLTVR